MWARQCRRWLRPLVAVLSGIALAAAQSPLVSGPLAQRALPITGSVGDYDQLLATIGDARFVLLGESTHGTSDFYHERARISRRLIRERGFAAVMIEADVPEVERLNQYVRGMGVEETPAETLSGFTRFPRWMWQNVEFRDFVEQLRADNLLRPAEERVGIYGMDVNDLFGAIDMVRAYLRAHAPGAEARVGATYRCFAPFRRSTEAYGTAARKPSRSCEGQAVALAAEVDRLSVPDTETAREERFTAARSAAALVAGEAYFRAVYAGAYSWNVRERSMAAAIEAAALSSAAPSMRPGKVVVWAHNSHVGNATSTEMANSGEVSLADLLRRTHLGEVFSLGFLTRSGTVMAAPAWDRPAQIYRLPSASRDSVEALLHRSGLDRSLLILRNTSPSSPLAQRRPQRAIGVTYRPSSERNTSYIQGQLASQFDSLVYLDQTRAVSPVP